MGLDTALGSLLAAFGLSGAAGLNAWLPLFASALLARLDVVELAAPYDDLTSTPALILLGGMMTADFVGDKIPVVDHVLHAVGSGGAPGAGATRSPAHPGLDPVLRPPAAGGRGAATAGAIHAGRAAVRPVSTATTGGMGNPLLSLGEDAGSLVLVVTSFVLPLIALVLLVLLVLALVSAWRRLRRVSYPS